MFRATDVTSEASSIVCYGSRTTLWERRGVTAGWRSYFYAALLLLLAAHGFLVGFEFRQLLPHVPRILAN